MLNELERLKRENAELARQLADLQQKLAKHTDQEQTASLTEATGELEQARAALKTSEERYRAVLETRSVMVSRHTPDGRLTFVNLAYCEFWGKSPDDLLGSNIFDDLIPDLAISARKHLASLTPENPSATHEHANKNLHGEIRWVIWTDQVFFGPQGSILEYQTIGVDITERRNAELALQESQRHYRAVVEDQSEMISRYLPDGTLTFVNSAYCEFCGKSAEELIGTNLYDHIPANLQERSKENLAKLTLQQPIAFHEHEIENQQGETCWHRWSDRAIFNEDNELLGYQSVGTDISEQVKVENALQESEMRYRAVVENQSEMISQHLPDGTLTFVNPASCEFWGKSAEDLIGTNLFDNLPPELRDITKKRLESLTPQKTTAWHESPITDNQGKTCWHRWSDRAIFNEDGELLGYQSVGIDISDRVQAENALRESEARYRTVVEDLTEMVSRFKPDGTFTYLNQAYCEFWNQTADKLVGKNLLDLINPQNASRARAHLKKLVDENRLVSREIEVIDPQGEKRWHIWTDRPICDEQGEVIEYQSVGMDITERKEIENALLESELRYRSVVEDLSEMVLRYTPDGTFTYVNRTYAEFWGMPASKLVGVNMFDMLFSHQPREIEVARANLAKLTPECPTSSHEIDVIAPTTGKRLWHRWTDRGIFDEQGELLGYQGVGMDITERKAMEEALRESERVYRSVVESQSERIAQYLPDGTLTFVNPAYCAYWGKTEKELLGANLFDLINPDLVDKGKAQLAMLTPDHPHAVQEHPVVNPQGKRHWERWSDRAIFDDDGTLLGYLAVGIDITERMQAVEALQQSEARFRAVVDIQSEMISRFLPDGTITFMNTAFCEYWGKPLEDLQNNNLFDMMNPENVEPARQHLAKLTPKNPAATHEHTVSDQAGGQRWHRWTDRGIYDEHGELMEYQSVGQDITAHKEAEEALRRSEEQYRLLVENISEVIFLIDKDGIFSYISPQVEKSTGRTPDQIIGHYFTNNCIEEDIPRMEEGFRQVLNGESQEIIFRVKHEDGSIRYLSTANRPQIENGEITGMNAVLTDITEQRRMEEALATSQKMADIGTLAAGIAHEIRSPLQVITGLSDRFIRQLERDQVDTQSMSHDVEVVKRNAWRIAAIANSLLHYAHASDGEQKEHDLNEIVSDTLLLIEHQLVTWQNINVTTRLNASALPIICERNKLSQVLINLLSNARDAMPAGGEITIQTYEDSQNEHIILRVADTGMGIPLEIQEKVFESFFTTKSAGEGTGLGLSITRSVIEPLGGFIRLDSAPGQGATFTLSFPQKR